MTSSKDHSEFGGSFADRGFHCSGSMALSAFEPDQSSVYAAEGTAAHELAAKCLAEQGDPKDYIGLKFNGFIVGYEMAGHVQTYLNAVRSLILFADDEYEVERKFVLHAISEKLFGTADAIVYQPSTKTLYVVDLKYGAGVFVDALENLQMLYYALGAALSHGNRGVAKIVMIIVQPRIHTEEGYARTFEIDAVTLLEWQDDLRAAYVRACQAREALPDDPNAWFKAAGPEALAWVAKYLKSGDHCQFCKAAHNCPLLEAAREEAASKEFADFATATPDELGRRLAVGELAASNYKALRKHAFEQGKAGNLPTGFKFVAKVARRKYTDADKALDVLHSLPALSLSEIATPKTPAQVEKTLGKAIYAHIAELVEAKSSGVNLVPLSNKKPAVIIDPDADFEDVDLTDL